MSDIKRAIAEARISGSLTESKWASKLNEVNKQLRVHGQKPLSEEKRMAMAKIMENTQKRISYDLREASQNFSPAGFSNNPTLAVGPYKRYAIDIIAAMVPSLINL